MFNKNQAHLVPQILLDRAELMLSRYGNSDTKEIYAQQLEVVQNFCEQTLNQYRKATKTKRKVTV